MTDRKDRNREKSESGNDRTSGKDEDRNTNLDYGEKNGGNVVVDTLRPPRRPDRNDGDDGNEG